MRQAAGSRAAGEQSRAAGAGGRREKEGAKASAQVRSRAQLIHVAHIPNITSNCKREVRSQQGVTARPPRLPAAGRTTPRNVSMSVCQASLPVE